MRGPDHLDQTRCLSFASRARRSGLIGLLLPGMLGMFSMLSTLACKDSPPKTDPHSLAALEAEGPQHTPDCRSWDKIDYEALPALPDAPHMAAFDQVWRTVGQKHYDPTLACLDWPALREQYAKKILEAGQDSTAAYVAINELLGLLGQSHLHATSPTPSTTRKRDIGPAMIPISVRWLALEPGATEFGAVVVNEAVDAHPSGLPRGAILTAVAGESIDDVAKDVAKGVHDRGGSPTETAFMITQAIGAMLSCPVDGTKTVSFLDPGQADAKRELDITCFVPEGERISLGNLRNLPTTVESRMIPDHKVGYLAFNFWMLPMTQRLRSGVDELRDQGMAALIIDLRGNPGGVGAMSIPIARMFVREGASLGVLQMREFNQEFNIEPNPDAFDGPIVILVDEGTASTSEIFAVGMRDIGRVSIAGAGPSVGMALPSMIETLPDGGMIQYVVGDYHSDKGSAAEGQGVVPDIVVTESRADYAAGRDPVLDAAVKHLRERVPDTAATAPAP